ncbi:MAG: DUF58 domain-containing protein [Kofleriaceae bacterium]
MRFLGIATLFVPPIVAAVSVSVGGHGPLVVAGFSLAVVWVVMAAVLMMRFVDTVRPSELGRPWEQLDPLTSTGRMMMWTGSAAIICALFTGWASFSVLGLFGIGVTCLVVIWTTIVTAGERPWRGASVTRQILPETAVEGEPVREEVEFRNVRIPVGMRLFATGRATRHGVITRYAIGAEGSGADVKLETDLGPALRGEHRVPALALRFGDVLGLTRTPFVYRGDTQFTVMPKPHKVDGVRELLGNGGDDQSARPTHWLPTEGTFRIREYVPGDDTRRIHWVRSLQANQIVVRLPDEIPPADPTVRVILDNCLDGTDSLTCQAPRELLDALVRVWLGIGKALSDTGTRVTLVTAARGAEDPEAPIKAVRRPMVAHTSRESLRLGSRVTWQGSQPLASIIDATGPRQIVVSSRPRPRAFSADIVWVVVPEVAWTSPEPWPAKLEPSNVRLPYPAGSAENRLLRRHRERKRVVKSWNHRALFSQVLCWVDWQSLKGGYVARPKGDGRVSLEVIP